MLFLVFITGSVYCIFQLHNIVCYMFLTEICSDTQLMEKYRDTSRKRSILSQVTLINTAKQSHASYQELAGQTTKGGSRNNIGLPILHVL